MSVQTTASRLQGCETYNQCNPEVFHDPRRCLIEISKLQRKRVRLLESIRQQRMVLSELLSDCSTVFAEIKTTICNDINFNWIRQSLLQHIKITKICTGSTEAAVSYFFATAYTGLNKNEVTAISKAFDEVARSVDRAEHAILTEQAPDKMQALQSDIKADADLRQILEGIVNRFVATLNLNRTNLISTVQQLPGKCKKVELLVIPTDYVDVDIIQVMQYRSNTCRNKGYEFIAISHDQYNLLMNDEKKENLLFRMITKLSFLHHSDRPTYYIKRIAKDVVYLPSLREIVLRACSAAGSRLKNRADRITYNEEQKALLQNQPLNDLSRQFFVCPIDNLNIFTYNRADGLPDRFVPSQDNIQSVKKANIRARTEAVSAFPADTHAYDLAKSMNSQIFFDRSISIKGYVGGYMVADECVRPFIENVYDREERQEKRDSAQPKALRLGPKVKV